MFDSQETTSDGGSADAHDQHAEGEWARARLVGIQDRFIQRWGDLANVWGTQRSGGRLHSLLFVSPEPLDAEGIGERLQISHGNTSTTLRQLLGAGVIRRLHRPGERRAYYTSEPDPWQWMRNTVAVRRERELLPVVNAMRELLAETTELASQAPEELADELAATQAKIGEFVQFLEQLLALLDAFLAQPPQLPQSKGEAGR